MRFTSFSVLFTFAMCMLLPASPLLAADNSPSLDFGGRIHGDATHYENDIYEHHDGSELRRGRVYVNGEFAPAWEYKAQIELSGDEPEWKDLYVRYTGLRNTLITVGNFKQFSGLEYTNSSNNMTFTERAMVIGLVTDRRMGVGYQHWSDRYTLGLSAYTHEVNNSARGNGAGAHYVYRPQLGGEGTLHLGFTLSRETDDDDVVRFRARPDTHQDAHRIVDSGAITDVDVMDRYGLETAYLLNRLSVQAEYINQNVKRNVLPDVSFDGYYLSVAYFLTNDSRTYSNSAGAFGAVAPSSSRGAWEIAARYDTLDLTDQDIAGGSVDAVTLGVNYYLNRDVRFTANYVFADSDEVAGNDDPSALHLRMRITF